MLDKQQDTPAKGQSQTKRSGASKTARRAPAAPATRQRRAQSVAARTATRQTRSVKEKQSEEKGLADLLEHGLKDMYYAERKIYRALPKLIKAADDAALAEALSGHRDETQGHIETLEEVFAVLGLPVKAEKCDAIDGILAEGDSILEDFGGTRAGDAAIIFSAHAVEHYEIARYRAMVGFADALGLDEVAQKLGAVLTQETAAEAKMTELAEGSINEAASEYDDEDEADAEDGKRSAEAGPGGRAKSR